MLTTKFQWNASYAHMIFTDSPKKLPAEWSILPVKRHPFGSCGKECSSGSKPNLQNLRFWTIKKARYVHRVRKEVTGTPAFEVDGI